MNLIVRYITKGWLTSDFTRRNKKGDKRFCNSKFLSEIKQNDTLTVSEISLDKIIVISCNITNSLTIHQVWTKKIISGMVVWIPDPNHIDHSSSLATLFCRFLLYLMISLKSYIKHSKECFIRYPKTSKSVEK